MYNLKKLRKKSPRVWALNRSVVDYSRLFGQYFKNGLINELLKLAKNKSKLNILDDGCGHGFFLKNIKGLLGEKGIDVTTTGITITPTQKLKNLINDKLIDEVYFKPAELFVPTKKYDAIFSVYGSIHYSLKELQKDIVIKYAQALRKGGIMCVGLDIDKYQSSKGRDIRGDIIKSFFKRGFDAEFYTNEILGSGMNTLPRDVLIIKRVDSRK